MGDSKEHFNWGLRLRECFDGLKPTFALRSPPIVDGEIIPHFDGRPDDMVLWLICEYAADVPLAKSQLSDLLAAVQEHMRILNFPKCAVDTLRVNATSLEDIAAGGGSFYYFR